MTKPLRGRSTTPTLTNLHEIHQTFNNPLAWTREKITTINLAKTVAIHFNLANNFLPLLFLIIYNHTLEMVQAAKLLNITLDSKIRRDQHTTLPLQSTSFGVHMLRRLKALCLPTLELCTYTTHSSFQNSHAALLSGQRTSPKFNKRNWKPYKKTKSQT